MQPSRLPPNMLDSLLLVFLQQLRETSHEHRGGNLHRLETLSLYNLYRWTGRGTSNGTGQVLLAACTKLSCGIGAETRRFESAVRDTDISRWSSLRFSVHTDYGDNLSNYITFRVTLEFIRGEHLLFPRIFKPSPEGDIPLTLSSVCAALARGLVEGFTPQQFEEFLWENRGGSASVVRPSEREKQMRDSLYSPRKFSKHTKSIGCDLGDTLPGILKESPFVRIGLRENRSKNTKPQE